MVRPKLRKLDESPTLRGVVVDCLARRWSPGRISAWLEHAFSDDESMRISHEAIYSALYIQGKGSLRAELEEVMKTKDGECPILCVRRLGLQVIRESVGVSHG